MRRTILVTGATDGLGRELARRAHAADWNVLAHGRNPERLERLAAELDGARMLRADLSSLAEVAALAGAVVEATEQLDVLVNNAGVGSAEPGGGARVESVDGHELRVAVNYLAPYSLTRQGQRTASLRRSGFGKRGRGRARVGSQAPASAWRWSLSRLWVAVIRRHSVRTAALPLRWKRSMPRLCLVWPNTGSIIGWRWR
jgi:NAD(P)-dependent dehydrogenase (short-subunit alcohol dehydrogenase family)